MAKGLHAKSRKRARAAMRATVGDKQIRKVLRKTTRKNLKALVTGEKDELSKTFVKDLLSGVNGTAAHLVTEGPAQKKKLRYTFNHTYRQHRLETEMEDESDDEQEDDEDEEVLHFGGDSGAADGVEEVDVTEEAGRKKHPSKPVPKRGMSASYYDWQQKDLAQPHTHGKFDTTFDGRMGLRPTKHKKRGKTTKHVAVGSHATIFERLGREEKQINGSRR